MKEKLVGFSKAELRDFVNWAFGVLFVLSAGIAIWQSVPFMYWLVGFMSLVAVFFGYRYLRLRFQPRAGWPTSQLIARNIPRELKFFVEFFSSTICNNEMLPRVRGIDSCLHLTKYTKTFTVKGLDCPTEEVYEGINSSSRSYAMELMKIVFGGSSLRAEDLKVEAFEVEDDSRNPLHATIQEDRERLKIISFSFRRALPPGRAFRVIYKDFWPSCMRYGVDAVLCTEPLFYERGIEQIECRVKLDGEVRFIRAYSLDVDSYQWDLDEDQPRFESREEDMQVYLWTKAHPSSSRIYVIAFDRQPTRTQE